MPVRIGQIGTKHGHARGKWRALMTNDQVEAVGIWEPDADARASEQHDEAYAGAQWCASAADLLHDPSIAAIAVEGRNDESLAMAHAAVDAGKHLWFDKPAGDDWPGFQHLMEKARERALYVQMGYMFRYQPGFQLIAELVQSRVLGHIYAIRAHMSTLISPRAREIQSVHQGGIFYDLAGHMLDQIVRLLGRPERITLFARNDETPEVLGYSD